MKLKFKLLNKKIINCNSCKRLVLFRKKIAIKKTKKYKDHIYWGKPVIGFGDLNAEILIVGLAPAAHGGNRTGRAFTGDKSGDFLFKCLNTLKISNRSVSLNKNDGLNLKKTYITNILKCVPPEDKPLNEEIMNCSNYLDSEISNLKNLKVIVTLGKVAFDSYIKFYKKKYFIDKKLIFKHGKKYKLPDKKIVIPCYHPSPRNVNTGKITFKMLRKIFIEAKKII